MYIAIACAVIAFPLMITGAVYSKYAADDPRTPMVNQYNTAVNNWENTEHAEYAAKYATCLLYTSPSPRDATLSRMPSSA